MQILAGLEPSNVFYYFEKICQIPHGSGDTTAIGNYIETIAKEHHLDYRRDALGNIIIWKQAYPGYESAESVMLQGHMDMVNEKTTASTHDFSKDPLELFIEDDFIGARGTTLGGDDGIAVAFMLAILTDKEIPHPALECVFTVDEEIGLLGANGIDLSDCHATRMINLDSEEEGIFLTSCAGGIRVDLTIPATKESADEELGSFYEIQIDHCLGGHSGTDIGKNRCNPILLAGRLLFDLDEAGIEYRLCRCEGGLKDNAIPRSVRIVIASAAEKEADNKIRNVIGSLFEGYKKEYAVSDPDMTISVSETEAQQVLSLVTQVKFLFMLRMVPNGVQAMSQNIPDLVETSLNAGVMETREDELYLGFSIRSSVNTRKLELVNRLAFLAEYLGGEAATRGSYPGWEYKQESPLRDLMAATWEERSKRPAKIEAIHAGLECGIFAEKLPGIDMVSMGPQMKDIHTPMERLGISSSERCYRFLLEVLKRMKE